MENGDLVKGQKEVGKLEGRRNLGNLVDPGRIKKNPNKDKIQRGNTQRPQRNCSDLTHQWGYTDVVHCHCHRFSMDLKFHTL